MMTRLLKVAALLALSALLLLAGGLGAEAAAQEKERTLETIIFYETKLVKDGMLAVGDLLMKITTDPSASEEIWNKINEKYFRSFARVGYFEFKSLLKKEKNLALVARAVKWEEAIKNFTDDLQNVEEALYWLKQLNKDIRSMYDELNHSGDRIEGYLRDPFRDGPRAAAIAAELKTGKLVSTEIKKYLEEVQSMRSTAENISSSVIRTAEHLEENVFAQEEMDKRIVKILETWRNLPSRHPYMDPGTVDVARGWISLVKKNWETFKRLREDFQRYLGPLMAGKLFQDVPVYRDYEYRDLAKPFLDLERELKTALLAAVQKEKSGAELLEAIRKDEELTRREREQLMELYDSVSVEKKRTLQLEHERAGGGINREREIQLLLSRLPEDSEEYRRLREEAILLSEHRHPEQLAVEKRIREFEELERKVSEQARKIIIEHEKRRLSLGMEPGIFSR